MLRKVYFEVKVNTRLANWMFQFAAAKSICPHVGCVAETQDMHERIKAGWPFEELEILDAVPDGAYVYTEPASHRYAPISYPEDAEVLFLKGYFQSDKYFQKDIVRGCFAIDCERRDRLKREYAEILAKPNVTGISVRRTDYLIIQHCHPFTGTKYYRDCFKLLPEANDFIVCSDDIAWCQKYFPMAYPEKNFFFMAGKPVLDQLYIHSLCKNVIMSNSTFCWWPAWLNENKGKRILAPSLWFGFALQRLGVDWSDMYFDGVEVVDNGYGFWRLMVGYKCLYWLRFKARVFPAWKIVRGLFRKLSGK